MAHGEHQQWLGPVLVGVFQILMLAKEFHYATYHMSAPIPG